MSSVIFSSACSPAKVPFVWDHRQPHAVGPAHCDFLRLDGFSYCFSFFFSPFRFSFFFETNYWQPWVSLPVLFYIPAPVLVLAGGKTLMGHRSIFPIFLKCKIIDGNSSILTQSIIFSQGWIGYTLMARGQFSITVAYKAKFRVTQEFVFMRQF